MWRARPLSDTAPPKAVPLTHGEARGSVTWTNAVDDEENERRPPEKAAADDFCEPSKTVKVPPSSKLPRPPPKNSGTKIPVDRDAAGAPRGLPDQGAVRGAVWPKAAFGAPDPCEACPDLSVRLRTPSGVAGRRPARRPGGART